MSNENFVAEDCLYHLGLSTKSHDLVAMFGDVQFVCMGGSARRMKNFAQVVADHLEIPTGKDGLVDLTGHADRYSMYKVGPVIAVNHGIGIPSMLVLLHELIKLVKHARCDDVTFIRIGTSGGIGVQPGTVVLTDAAVDECLNKYYETKVLGKKEHRPSIFDTELVNEVKKVAQANFKFPVTRGTTMSANDFYEGQGRLDGAICNYKEEDKMAYLRKLSEAGVVNIEMEALCLGAVLTLCKLKGMVICVTLLDRLKGDQVDLTEGVKSEWELRPQLLAAAFIKSKILK